MKTDRPMNRFWFAALSGTILNANPSDIAGPMDIIGSEVWDNQKHPYHPISRSELKKLGRIVDKSIEGQGDPKAQANLWADFTTFLNPKI